jgi:hypothetical protein
MTEFGSLQIQERDIELLRGLFESRIMTTDHIAAIYFNGKREYAKKRLQRLKAAGFVQERRRLVSEPSILFLTRKAFIMLRNTRALTDYPALSLSAFESRANVSEFTIRHELAVMEIKAAFHAAIRKNTNYAIAEFSTWPRLYEFKRSERGNKGMETSIKPDGFIRLLFKDEIKDSYFLEVDRSTEAQSRLIARSLAYHQFYYDGGFAVRNGGTRHNFKKFPFRVLMVFASAERRNNTAELLLRSNPPILSLVWLTTFEDITADSLGAIWIQPRDYCDVTKNTPFDSTNCRNSSAYRRNPKREGFIEANIKKNRLLF